MSGDPIWIRCEGSGCPTHQLNEQMKQWNIGVCQMCGRMANVEAGVAVEHERDDVLDRIERGDFG